MLQFIELTDTNRGDKILISVNNITNIDRVYSTESIETRIYLSHGRSVIVEESYDEIKNMILNGKHNNLFLNQ